MTAAEPEAAAPAASSTAYAVEEAALRLPGIDLRSLDGWAALLTRLDRKYVVTLPTFDRLVARLGDDWHALDIGGRRGFGYTSTYFDTEDLGTYRAHVQGRRRRYKVRTRRYDDTDGCMLEVKRKGLRGLTVKDRTPHPVRRSGDLGLDGRAFVETALSGYAVLPDAPLAPVVVTGTRRTTLVSVGSQARLTVDSDVRCGWGDRCSSLKEGLVLLESKVANRASEVDRLLRLMGERPVDISKFCVGIAARDLGLPSNPWRRTMRRHFDTPVPRGDRP